MIKTLINWVEHGYVPDWVVRAGIRRLVRQRLTDEFADDVEKYDQQYRSFLTEISESKLAIDTDKANEQHYEINAEFYQYALGERKKYSACYYQDNESLNKAELNMLEMYAERGKFFNGQQVLELGCGWGSITLFLAEKFPESQITAVSNSHSQRKYILKQVQQKGLKNVKVITCDINELELNQKFDRVISIEMFEHVRNYRSLFNNISEWLLPDGKIFIHIFCHKNLMYPFLSEGDDNWMGRYFFSGGQMPAVDTFYHFQEKLKVEQRWLLSGQHYAKTANDWLNNMDTNKNKIMPIFEQVYQELAALWFQRWRIFFMSCAELFGYANGQQWLVAHYLMSPQNK